MSPTLRIQELEDALRDIVVGCDVMLQIQQTPSHRRFIEEVRRVARAPLSTHVVKATKGEGAAA
jgi:hypothetical protein